MHDGYTTAYKQNFLHHNTASGLFSILSTLSVITRTRLSQVNKMSSIPPTGPSRSSANKPEDILSKQFREYLSKDPDYRKLDELQQKVSNALILPAAQSKVVTLHTGMEQPRRRPILQNQTPECSKRQQKQSVRIPHYDDQDRQQVQQHDWCFPDLQP